MGPSNQLQRTVFQVLFLEPCGSVLCWFVIVACSQVFVVNWFRQDAFGPHANDWLALAIVIFVSFASCVASLKLVFWFLTRKRDTDESESESTKEYWRIHGE
jgi:hypothetical protein